MGSGLTPDHSHSRPADVLVAGWEEESHLLLILLLPLNSAQHFSK